jgi:hypothetical protein
MHSYDLHLAYPSHQCHLATKRTALRLVSKTLTTGNTTPTGPSIVQVRVKIHVDFVGGIPSAEHARACQSAMTASA